MAYEIDFLAVGEGERYGDAIALRLGNLTGKRDEQQVWVIDGMACRKRCCFAWNLLLNISV